MGQYVNRTDPETGSDRNYYKADNGKLYNDYNAAASANMNPVARVQRWAGDVFSKPQAPNYKGPVGNSNDPVFDADGNVTPAALTILEQSNTGAKLIRTPGDRNLLAKTAEQLDPIYDNRAYANPYNNSTYVGGEDLSTLVHELGHLDKSQRSGAEHLTRGVGVLGRALTEVGKLPGLNTGLIQPVNIAAGLARRFGDANEEDVAERYRHQYSSTLFNDQKDSVFSNSSEMVDQINKQGSDYGNSERELADQTLFNGLDPTGLIRGTAAFANDHVVAPYQQHQRTNRINELTDLHKQDQTRFQQLPEDHNNFTAAQRTFMEEASNRTRELDRLNTESMVYQNQRQR